MIRWRTCVRREMGGAKDSFAVIASQWKEVQPLAFKAMLSYTQKIWWFVYHILSTKLPNYIAVTLLDYQQRKKKIPAFELHKQNATTFHSFFLSWTYIKDSMYIKKYFENKYSLLCKYSRFDLVDFNWSWNVNCSHQKCPLTEDSNFLHFKPLVGIQKKLISL